MKERNGLIGLGVGTTMASSKKSNARSAKKNQSSIAVFADSKKINNVRFYFVSEPYLKNVPTVSSYPEI